MPLVPTWDQYMVPCLRVLSDGEVHRPRPILEKAADMNRPGMSGELIRWKDLSHGTSLEVPDRVA